MFLKQECMNWPLHVGLAAPCLLLQAGLGPAFPSGSPASQHSQTARLLSSMAGFTKLPRLSATPVSGAPGGNGARAGAGTATRPSSTKGGHAEVVIVAARGCTGEEGGGLLHLVGRDGEDEKKP
ncbi:hypothetical protein E2C01_033292 [Portunus trituberculatus]|uniref:Uncharacterized protein n=1 Tax=Portunus trituberculatus TaxID=210409 RepID=A0A5B7F562_PORTR|nr:hypothetical protein [Portunus trituberculatus]